MNEFQINFNQTLHFKFVLSSFDQESAKRKSLKMREKKKQQILRCQL